MRSKFDGQVSIVTGAAQGIGRAVAMRLAQEGARVMLIDRVPEQLARVAAEIAAAGGVADTAICDLETASGVRSMVDQTLERHGVIDVSVHCVGGTIWSKPFWEYADEEIEKEISRSLWPTLRSCHAVLPVMLKQRRGAIVNIGSVATRGIYRVPYAAAKGGIHAMTACLAMELKDSGVRINCVSPGGIENSGRAIPRNPNPVSDREKGWRQEVIAQTKRDTPMERYGTVAEVASAVSFLASEESSYVTGQVLFVAGGGIG